MQAKPPLSAQTERRCHARRVLPFTTALDPHRSDPVLLTCPSWFMAPRVSQPALLLHRRGAGPRVHPVVYRQH